ncbi:MAG: hypothetical protein V2A55_03215 [Candidatus Jorgensenbacteria bacterium]
MIGKLKPAIALRIGLALLGSFFLPFASLIAFFDMFALLLFYGVDEVTFRDFGLLMAALGLFLLTSDKSKPTDRTKYLD